MGRCSWLRDLAPTKRVEAEGQTPWLGTARGDVQAGLSLHTEQVLWQEAKLLRERKTYMAMKGRVLHPLFEAA